MQLPTAALRGSEVASMTEPLPTRCLLHQVLYQRTSPYGDPYAVALMIDPAGNTHTALACSKLFGDLDKLSELEVCRGRSASEQHGCERRVGTRRTHGLGHHRGQPGAGPQAPDRHVDSLPLAVPQSAPLFRQSRAGGLRLGDQRKFSQASPSPLPSR